MSNSGFSTNTNMGTNANFGTNPSFATTTNSTVTSMLQNQNPSFAASPSYGTTPTLQYQTPTSWSYNEPSTTPTPWSTTTATPTPWDNNETYPQQSPTVQNVSNYNDIEAQKQAQILQAQRNAVNQILMNGMDVLYGMNRTINGMTAGGLDYLGQKFGFDSQMNNYLQLKNPQERELAQNVGQLAQLGGGALTGGALASSKLAKEGYNQANMAYNKFTQWNGRHNLTNQLQRGNNFKDIYMGKIDKDKLNTLNSVRRSEGAEFIPSRKVSIPKDRVQHIYEERIIGDGYTPKEAADTIYDAMFNSNSKIQASRYKTLQKFDSPTPNRAIVGKIRDGNSIFIKTGYRK